MFEKRVDEDWKKRAETEKARDETKAKGESRRAARGIPEASFTTHVLEMQMQALLALGDIEHPVTRRRERNLEHARYLIDVLAVLKDKTQGNLDPEEEAAISDTLAALQMRFVQVAGSPAPPGEAHPGSGADDPPRP